MSARLSAIARQVSSAALDPATDRELLARYLSTRDEVAFTRILQRHGPMVWGICRNLLNHAAEADDAFQAVFLAFIRGAKQIQKPDSLGVWFHGVTIRVVKKLKRSQSRQRHHECKVAQTENEIPISDTRWDDLIQIVHEEVHRLPEAERTVFVLCCLEGVRQPVAAEQLGWKPGTLTGRLSRARQRLLDRLAQRGIASAVSLGALGIGATTSQALIPQSLFQQVNQWNHDDQTIPSTIIQLSQGVVEMSLGKIKWLAASLILAGGIGMDLGIGVLSKADAQSTAPARTAPKAKSAPAPVVAAPAPEPTGPAPTLAGAPPARLRSHEGIWPSPAATVPSPAVAPATAPARWDHKVVALNNASFEALKEILDRESVGGWELVAIDSFPSGQSTVRSAIFKRRLSSAATSTSPRATKAYDPMMGLPASVLPPNTADLLNDLQEYSIAPLASSGMMPSTPPTALNKAQGIRSTVPNYDPLSKNSNRSSPNVPSSGNLAPTRLKTSNVKAPEPVPEGSGYGFGSSSTLPPPTPYNSHDKSPSNLKLHTISLRACTATNVAKVLKELIAINEYNDDVTAVIADEDNNALLIKATSSGATKVQDQIKQLEEAAQVRLKEQEMKETEAKFRKKP